VKSDSRKSRRWVSGTLVLLVLGWVVFESFDQLYLAWKYRIPSRARAWVSDYGYGNSDLVAFRFGAGRVGVPLVDVDVDGRSLALIFDTGTRGVASLADQTIGDLNLRIIEHTDWRDSSGQVLARVPVAEAMTLALGPIKLGPVRIPGLGPEHVMGKREGYSGTLGWGAFDRYRVSIDYANELLAFSLTPLPAVIRSCESRHVTGLVVDPNIPGLLLLEAQINAQPVLIQLDTGKSSTVFDRSVFDLDTLADQDIRVGPFEVPIRHARMGSLAGFSGPGNRPVVAGLGSDFLTGFLITIDYPGKQLVIERANCP
jgi:hypothetical protein